MQVNKKKKDVKDLSVGHCTWYILTGRMEVGERQNCVSFVFGVYWGVLLL